MFGLALPALILQLTTLDALAGAAPPITSQPRVRATEHLLRVVAS